jgi:TPR repeat protein
MGVAEDDVEAYKWYRKASEQGVATAQSNLGFMYTNGEGVAEDYVEAYK